MPLLNKYQLLRQSAQKPKEDPLAALARQRAEMETRSFGSAPLPRRPAASPYTPLQASSPYGAPSAGASYQTTSPDRFDELYGSEKPAPDPASPPSPVPPAVPPNAPPTLPAPRLGEVTKGSVVGTERTPAPAGTIPQISTVSKLNSPELMKQAQQLAIRRLAQPQSMTGFSSGGGGINVSGDPRGETSGGSRSSGFAINVPFPANWEEIASSDIPSPIRPTTPPPPGFTPGAEVASGQADQELLQQRLRELLSGGAIDTAAEERALAEQFRADRAASLLDAKARSGFGGMGLSGAASAIESDIGRKFARDQVLAQAALRRSGRDEEMQRTLAGIEGTLGLRQSDIEQKAFDTALKLLEAEIGSNAGSAPSAGNPADDAARQANAPIVDTAPPGSRLIRVEGDFAIVQDENGNYFRVRQPSASDEVQSNEAISVGG